MVTRINCVISHTFTPNRDLFTLEPSENKEFHILNRIYARKVDSFPFTDRSERSLLRSKGDDFELLACEHVQSIFEALD